MKRILIGTDADVVEAVVSAEGSLRQEARLSAWLPSL